MWAKPQGARAWHWFAFDSRTLSVPSVCESWRSKGGAKPRHSKPKEKCCNRCSHWLDSGAWKLRTREKEQPK